MEGKDFFTEKNAERPLKKNEKQRKNGPSGKARQNRKDTEAESLPESKRY